MRPISLVFMLTMSFGVQAQEPAGVPVAHASRSPSWAAGGPSVLGALPTETISAGGSTIDPQVQSCFSAERSQRPDAEGPVALAFTVRTDGVPVDVQAMSTIFEHTWFLGCLESAMGLMRFPTAAETTKVNWLIQMERQSELLGGVGGLLGVKVTPVGGGGSAVSGAVRIGGPPLVMGALDASLIDAVVMRNMDPIRVCYQRELIENKTLAGKVTVKFVIGKDGTVRSAEPKTTTMNNVAVGSCLCGVFSMMKFPEPKGGGLVIVSYPFIFQPG